MSIDPQQERFELPIVIRAADIDELSHVNNVVYVRWVQEAATAHWRAAATPEQQAEVLWVVTRHEIDYRQPAKLGDAVLARTWVGGAQGRSFERFTEILRPTDGRVFVRALTLWCPIDPVHFRPTRVSEGVRTRFSLPEPPADA